MTFEDTAITKVVADLTPALICYIDNRNRFQYVNPSFERWVGRPQNEIIGSSIQDFFGESFFKTHQFHFESVRLGQEVKFEAQIPHVTGNPRESLWVCRADLGPDSELRGLLLQITDNEEHKKSEQRFLHLAQNLRNQVIHVVDLNPMRLAYVSPSYERVWGRTVQSLEENLFAFMEGIHPEDRTYLEEAVKAQEYGLATEINYRVVRPDGVVRWIRDSSYPVLDANGRIIRCTGIAEDITEQKLYQEEIKASQQRFKMIAEAIPTLVWTADRHGAVTYYNQRWLDYTEVPWEQAKGWGWIKTVHPEDSEDAKSAWHESVQKGIPLEREQRVRRGSDGQYRWHLVRAVPTKDDKQEILDWIGTLTDIHEQKMAQIELRKMSEALAQDLVIRKKTELELREAKEAAERANSSKTTFLANMSHEIRTPMTAVLGFTEVLKDPDLTVEERVDALSRIERSGRALLTLIDDILDISKVEAGKLSTLRARFSPIEVVAEVTSLLRLQAEQKGLKLSTKLAASVPASAYSDAARVRQILTNLIGNAIKFTPHGEVRVEMRVESDPILNQDYLIFDVCDTGIGITEADQKKLFQPFAQADPSITRQYGGTGLGLALSKRLAQQLGGDLILVESRLHRGSRFRVRIEAGPFEWLSKKEGASDLLLESLKSQMLRENLTNTRILVADDVTDNQTLMRRYLESAGARVDLASDGEEAILKALDHHYDVILMDIQMPRVDGIQATKRLRAQGYVRPILALTAHAMGEEVVRSIEAGCDEHLTKPLTRQGLVASIRRYLKASGASQTPSIH